MKCRTPLFHILTLLAFLANVIGSMPVAYAADEFLLPAPGVMVHLSPEFNPPMLKGIKVHPNNPFLFDFILNKGDSQLGNDQLKIESTKLIKYFLASLTLDLSHKDKAQLNNQIDKVGGIDLTPINKDLQIQNKGGEIKFHLDPAMLRQLQNTPGFVPVIVNIQPMTDLRMFLGVAE